MTVVVVVGGEGGGGGKGGGAAAAPAQSPTPSSACRAQYLASIACSRENTAVMSLFQDIS